MAAQPQPAARGGLDALAFDNRYVAALPADPESGNFRREVRACYSRVRPTPVRRAALVAHSQDAADLLGLSPETCASEAFAEVFAGNSLLDGMAPIATCYGGHQFGNWAGQLGDGRAINLGEAVTGSGRWTLQLKGAGPTPYSRSADGFAVLRSSLREFLCSEAMHYLGVPTTRALSLVLTGEEVVRDILYDGHPAPEPGAVVCRMAPSFTRFGHFEILAARQQTALLRRFLDFTIAADFPHLAEAPPRPCADPGAEPSAEPSAQDRARWMRWFHEVCERTLAMVVEWMRVGFVHGVMNTDNMSVLGLTIDYGPYGWLEGYDPNWTPNTTDAATRRYRYGQQPAVAQWNLLQLARAIAPLIGEAAPLNDALEAFGNEYRPRSEAMLRSKLGLKGEQAGDQALFDDLFALLAAAETDMTLFFRNLADVDLTAGEGAEGIAVEPLEDAYYQRSALTPALRQRLEAWLGRYAARVRRDGGPNQERIERMNAANPRFVLRNYLAQQAIDKAEAGDYAMVRELLEVLRRPYDEQPRHAPLAAKRPEWARHRPGCSALSCSS